MVKQAPESGGQVDKGSTVTIYVGVFTPTEGRQNQVPASP